MIDGFRGDLPGSDASMFIQWKGTDVCVDFICACGEQGHYDGYFAYVLRCPACDRHYEMGTQVVARSVRQDEIEGVIVRDLDLD